MATFIREHGERVLDRLRVSTMSEARLLMGDVILTDRRVVLSVDRDPPGFGLLGLFGAVLGALVGPAKQIMSHQIRRTDFSDAELIGKDRLKVRSKGEGYGMLWFEVCPVGRTSVRTHKALEWSDRLHQWAAGTFKAAPLPSAKLTR